MPLLKEGHLGTMAEGTPSNIPCGRICQLEVHQLLHSEAQVVYPEGLNRCLVPVITTLPESLSHGITMLNNKTTFLQVNILQFTTNMIPNPISQWWVQPLLPPHALLWSLPTRQTVKSAWPWRSVNSYHGWPLDTSSQALGHSTSKRPMSLALGAPHPHARKVSSNQWTPPLRCPCRQMFQMMLNKMIQPLKGFPY